MAAPALVPDINSITIDWVAPMTTEVPIVVNDGGSDITSYEIWVGAGTSGNTQEDIDALTPTISGLPATRTEYEHIGLRPNTPYFYRMRAKNSASDGTGPWSLEATVTTRESSSGTPGAPTAEQPTLAGGTVTFGWTAPLAANRGTSPLTGYIVEYVRDDDNDTDFSEATSETISTPTTLEFVHKNVEGGVGISWAYRVRAVNGSGAGDWSTPKQTLAVPARAPNAPELTATAISDSEILLEWNVPIANGSTIDGFEVQMWENDFNNTDLLTGVVDTSDTTAFTVEDLTGGTEYFFIVRALTDTGTEGLWSSGATTVPAVTTDAASATTLTGVPEAPEVTVPESGDNDPTHDTITLTWTAPADGGSDITGYEVRIWANGQWVPEGNVEAEDEETDATEYSYEDEGLAPGTRYYYVVRAANGTGSGPWSALATGVTDPGNPDAPTLTATAISETEIRLNWNRPNSNGATLTGYALQRWNPDATPPTWEVVAGFTTTGVNIVTEYVDGANGDGLDSGTKYYYRIRATPHAVDTDGDGAFTDEGWSAENPDDVNVTSATTDSDAATVPGMPTSLEVAVDSTTANTLSVTWGLPADTTASELTGYELRIWDTVSSQWVVEATPDADDTSYADEGLAYATTYYYILRAKNAEGDGPWTDPPVSEETGDVDADVPVLTATATGTDEIRLTWEASNDNGATDFTGYVLQRWNTDVTAPGTPGWSANIVVPGGTDSTLYIDRRPGLDPPNPLAAGTTYYYRIRTNDNEEGWSTVVSATTVEDAPGRPEMVSAAPDGQEAIDLSWNAPAKDGGNAIVHYHIEMWNTDTRRLDACRRHFRDAYNLQAPGPGSGHTLCLPRARREPGDNRQWSGSVVDDNIRDHRSSRRITAIGPLRSDL